MEAWIGTDEDQLALRALSAGKPPAPDRDFLVGRQRELALNDIDLGRIRAGSGALRILVGECGVGKSALMGTMAERARYQEFVTMSAEISTDRLLYARGGEARALLEAACLSQKTLGSSEGGAMGAVVGRFRDDCLDIANVTGRRLAEIAKERLVPLESHPGGYDFSQVIQGWVMALDPPRPHLQSRSRRWLSAGYTNSAEAREDLGIRHIVGDADFWPFIKLWGRFIRIAGRPGLVLFIDEARQISDCDPRTRARNHALLLSIYNEVIAGQVPGVGIVLAATPDMLIGDFNSLCSERGLGSCLQQGPGQADDLIDRVAISISPLSTEELTEVLSRVRSLVGRCRPTGRLMTDDELSSFLNANSVKLGNQTSRHTRDLIQRFIAIQVKLAANPSLQWHDIDQSGQSKSEFSNSDTSSKFGHFAERNI
jgi:hypothetical protein